MPFVNTNNAQIYYETHGEGSPIVLAHGAGGNTLVWWQQIAHFAADYKVVAFDHRGWGRSKCAPEHKHARHFAADMQAVMDAAGVDRAAIVCQSMGGWTGMQFTLANPARVSCLVLSGTPGGVQTPCRNRSARCPRTQPHHRPRPPRPLERASPGTRSRRLRQEPGFGIPLPPAFRPEPAHRRHRHRRHRRITGRARRLQHPHSHGRGRSGPHIPARSPERSLAGHPRRPAPHRQRSRPLPLLRDPQRVQHRRKRLHRQAQRLNYESKLLCQGI